MEASQLTRAFAHVNGLRLHYASAGEGPMILFAHGFPEFWYAWSSQLSEFSRCHRAVALDMRGYNLSSKPESVESYRMPHLVEDLRALAEHLGYGRFTLVGHDWGGAVAWAFALAHPECLDRLVILNAPHPAIFARELRGNPAQQRASAYFELFRSPAAEGILSRNNYAALTKIVAPHGGSAYLEAWSQPGALTGGLNYYRAMRSGAPDVPRISTPTLVIWGEKDSALLTGNLDGLEEHVEHLTVRRIPEGSHWVIHEYPQLVNAHIRAFLA